ncbi:MAG TPA: LolA-related protein [Casimicrobiaceae bacterium]|jgi:outer membrane lipoprotein-sorting protein
MRDFVAAVLAVAASASMAMAQASPAFSLDDLAALRAGVQQDHARFREIRHLAALTAPLQRSGTLAYRRPDHLEMNVEAPAPERLVIDRGRLTITNASGERTLVLDSEPALLAWTESLRATLAGDVAALSRHFDVQLSGTAVAWTLALVPRDPALASQIAAIDIAGEGASVRRVRVRERGGDDSVMDIDATEGASRP